MHTTPSATPSFVRTLLVTAALVAAILGLPGDPAHRAHAEDAPAPSGEGAKEGEKEGGKEGADAKKEEQERRNLTRGYLCFQFGLAQLMEAEQRQEHGVKVEKGLIISGVTPGGPADDAGVRIGDVPVSYFGHPLPDASTLPAEADAFGKFIDEFTRPIVNQIDPGMTVEMVVLRDGKQMTFKVVAVSHATMHALGEAAQQESWSVKVPPAVDRGPAKAGTFDFQTVPADASVPADFLPVTGWWEVIADAEGSGNKPGNKVLQQSSDEMGLCFGLVVADGRVYTDATARTRFRLVSGERSVSAGMILRAKDRKNYYAVVVDGVEQALSVIKVERAESKVIGKVAIPSPRLKTWLALSVTAKGSSITATMGDATVTVQDTVFASGWWGLCTAQDATTMFDDLTITPGGK